jgi:DNA-binding transcriptional LysR family regulator
MHRLDWSDLQYILAVANHGSLAAAARALGVNHSTVQRRITTFEDMHSTTIFDRRPDGYKLTVEGQQLLEAAQQVEEFIWELERKISGKDLKLEGTIRLTTTDTLLHTIVGHHLAEFRKIYPAIVMDISVTNSILSLTRRDADVAIRPAPAKPDTLVGESVGEFEFLLYASPEYIATHGHKTLDELHWLAPGDVLSGSTPGKWLRKHVPKANVVMTADSILALAYAAERGHGAVMLPDYLGDTLDGLERLPIPHPACHNSLWLLTHADLAGAARIRTFMEFMSGEMKPQLSGNST